MRRLKQDHGNVVVITALMMTTLLGFMAITIDAGAMLVRQSGVQTGVDAAALAVARRCAEAVVTGTTTCSTSIVDGMVSANAPDAVVEEQLVSTWWDGKAGRVTVTSRAQQRSYFSGALGLADEQTVAATATARWGPLTADDAVFPLAVCRGALPEIGEEFLLVVDRADSTFDTECTGAPGEPAFGWIAPDDTDLCTSKITLLPSTFLDVQPSHQPPGGDDCELALDELHNDIDKTAVCHETKHEPLHCHGSATSLDRQRDVVVYDAAGGSPGGRPSYALVSIEFVGARVGGRASHSAGGWSAPECVPATADPVTVDERQCIRGIVRANIPEVDGPIVDPALAALPGIDDTTVLDVRLVD